MRIKALLMISAVAAMAAPGAFAQTRSCAEIRQNNQVGGAIVGSILGGVLGSNVAAKGHKHDGTALGAVVGGMIGAGAGGNVRCAPPVQGYSYNPNYGGQSYGQQAYGQPNYGYSRYEDDPYLDGGRRYDDLYRSDRSAYKSDAYAGSDCTESVQVTRLPDGSEIRRPVHVCRDAYYGDWQVRD